MKLGKNGTVFDLLACLCSLLTKENERKCAVNWETAEDYEIQRFIEKYKNVTAAIMNASAREYIFDAHEILAVNDALSEISQLSEGELDEVYLLAREVEHRIDTYSDWNSRGNFFQIKPLNGNFKETGVEVYPHFPPYWSTGKSERKRENSLNAAFHNYMIFRTEDKRPFEVVLHYWDDTGLLQDYEGGQLLKCAIAPVTDSAVLRMKEEQQVSGSVIAVEGLINESEMEEKILKIFDAVFRQNYSVIIFPEVIGTKRLVDEIKNRMRMHQERCVLVVLPTFYINGENILIVLGPGGVEILRSSKGTPFILREKDGIRKKEKLKYSNQLHLLITRELGVIAFPICAEILEPDYYRVMVNVARADTVFCPSFSPGTGGFKNTLVKGIAGMMLSIWLNTCSAKSVSLCGQISDTVGIIQLPDADAAENPLYEIQRDCKGKCDGISVTMMWKYFIRMERFLFAMSIVNVHRYIQRRGLSWRSIESC